MNRFFSFLAGAVLGGLVGATFAILFAPSSGEALRNQLRERALTLQEEVKRAAAERRAELEQRLEALKSPHQSA